MRKILLTLFFSAITGLSLLLVLFISLFWPRPLPSTTAKSLPTISSISPKTTALYAVDKSEKSFARNFVVSDIHGRFESFKAALKAVDFSKNDRLFVLGDTIDRGPEGFKALLYLTHTLPSEGYHVVVLLGNHEEIWLEMANKGASDRERQSNLNGQIDIYEGQAPNGWEASRSEWNKLTSSERAFLLNEMASGFGEPHLLITKIDGKWMSFSHTANFDKSLPEETDTDLSWYNLMQEKDDSFQKSLAEKMGVTESQVQVFIGHIGGLRFGVHLHYICLDNTNTRNFNASPAVQLYEIENGKFYP